MTPAAVRKVVSHALADDWTARRYRVPCEAASDLDDARLVHADLPKLDAVALRLEATRVLEALAESDRMEHERDWLGSRLGAIDAERRRRTGVEAV